MSHSHRITTIGILVSVIGAIMILAGVILSSSLVGDGGSTSFGGVIVIGPIPVVFGTDKGAVLIAVIGAVILMVLAFAMLLATSRRTIYVVGENSA